ncbi:hypothetical protein CEP52_013660 [Fusarium oligoseptatum]|uniref:Uncharacterized protein n=1 Tax=Fusarium oligoseptatum TaxID=2604345 RepID=A0A428SSH7_9HYPO|nr:hypothetical protein CEP52_013660 [Fusarium oligoseptatum]
MPPSQDSMSPLSRPQPSDLTVFVHDQQAVVAFLAVHLESFQSRCTVAVSQHRRPLPLIITNSNPKSSRRYFLAIGCISIATSSSITSPIPVTRVHTSIHLFRDDTGPIHPASMLSGLLDAPLANGYDGHVHPPATSAKKAKGKKTMDSNEATRLLHARISQLEQDAAGEKDQELEIEREVKRANRDLLQQVSKMDNMQKIDHLTKRSSELLADMRRLERENQKNKRRGDNLQKERDTGRTELSKTVGLKEKLEKLCRELQRDNNRMKTENKELQTTQKRNNTHWDEKYATLLSKLEGYQEEKDTPKKQVVDMEVDELPSSSNTNYASYISTPSCAPKNSKSNITWLGTREKKKNAEGESAKARHLQAQVQAFTKTETELRNQLNVYVDKFKQVEDTLNNSNDLFLSFRKEMEDMSKKGKRAKKEATAANIIRMAEERQEWKKKTESAEKKSEKLMSIIQQMQQQGRKVPPGMANTVESCYSDSHGGNEGDESDYSDEEGEEEELSEFDDDTEEEPQSNEQGTPVPFGPERPPQPAPAAATNGH